MPRPPKNVRLAMQEAGTWDFDPTPPPFDPMEFFVSSAQGVPTPMPGVFDSTIDFSTPPPATFENGLPFGDLPELMAEALTQELPSPGVFQSLGLDGEALTSRVFSAACAAAAVQMATAHEGQGMGRSRFSNLASDVEVRLPLLVAQVVETLGEFTGPDGRRWFLRDYPSGVDALARAADQFARGWDFSMIRDMFWLPVRVDDGRTAAVVATLLSSYLSDRGLRIPANELIGAVFSGDVLPAVAAIAHQLPSRVFEPLKLLFRTYSTEAEFVDRFSSPQGVEALSLLGLEWENMPGLSLGFPFATASCVTMALLRWRHLQPVVEQALNVTFRKVRFRTHGDPLQVCNLRETPGGVVLTTHYSTEHRGASFRACVGTQVIYHSVPLRMRAVGAIVPREVVVPLVRNHIGLV